MDTRLKLSFIVYYWKGIAGVDYIAAAYYNVLLTTYICIYIIIIAKYHINLLKK